MKNPIRILSEKYLPQDPESQKRREDRIKTPVSAVLGTVALGAAFGLVGTIEYNDEVRAREEPAIVQFDEVVEESSTDNEIGRHMDASTYDPTASATAAGYATKDSER